MKAAKTTTPSPASIIEGYRPGLLGQIVTLHAETYGDWAGFGIAFERKVASDLVDFIGRLERRGNGLWHVLMDDLVVGSIAIDGEDLGPGRAHLRWFIVDPKLRGTGLGKQLLQRAIDFADQQGFTETHLWTLKGLDAARSLYERMGFILTDDYDGDQWGRQIAEQTFTRRQGGAP